MKLLRHNLARARTSLRAKTAAAICGGGVVTAMTAWLATGQAAILRSAVNVGSGSGRLTDSAGTNIFTVADSLLTPALYIVLAIAPLAIVWGAAQMMFGDGRHGPSAIGGAVIAVIIVACAKGIAA